jgi:type II secretory pathway component PulF
MRLSLQQKEQFFHELSEIVRSGRSVPEALEMVAASRTPAIRAVASVMRQGGGDGSAGSFFAAASTVFNSLDREIVQGGEASGRIDDALHYLSDYYASLARTRRKIIAGALYPIFILHFGAVMLAVPAFMSGGIEAFVTQALGFLAIFYVLFALAWMAFRAAARAAAVNPVADQMLQSIPAVGGTRIALVGSRFCMLMGILVKASGGILSAMTRSAGASGSALFARGANEAVSAVQGGATLGLAVARTRAFPESIDRAFQVGETSGRLDEEMTRQALRFTEQLNTRLDVLAGATGKFLLLAVTLTLGWKIISFYIGYYHSLTSMFQ